MADTFDRLKTALSNRYAIQEELGAGGMAWCCTCGVLRGLVVWRASYGQAQHLNGSVMGHR